MKRVSLTKDEKARIIDLNGKYPQQWTYIASLLGRPESTVRNFYKRFQMTGHIEEKQGRPPISPEKQKEIVDYFEKQPESTLRSATSNIDISISKMRGVLNQNQIHYMKKIPIPNLTDQHKEKRVQFSNYICNFPINLPPKLIITDESTVEVNLLKGGIWRRRGHYPPGSFKGKDAHPIHVMVWGGIGPGGYKTKLLRVNGKLIQSSILNCLQRMKFLLIYIIIFKMITYFSKIMRHVMYQSTQKVY